MVLIQAKMQVLEFCGCLSRQVDMLLWTIREILGVSVKGGHFLDFVDDLFFLGVGQSGCQWVFVSITLEGVGVSEDDLYAVLQSWVFVVLA